MKTFFVNGEVVKSNFVCPDNSTSCQASDYLEFWKPYCDAHNGVHVTKVPNPVAVQLKILSLCEECQKQRADIAKTTREK